MSPRLFFQIWSIEARRRMSYRADFWINTLIGFVVEFGVAYFIVLALFEHAASDRLGPYSRGGMVVYYLSVLLIAKIVRGPDFGGHISEDIYEGGLTRYLLFPASYFHFKYAQHVGALVPLLLQALLFGSVAVFVLSMPDELSITPLSVVMCLTSIAMANLLYFLMRLPLQAAAFWADNVWSLSVMLRFTTSLLGGAMLPLALYPTWARSILEYLPFRFLFDVPVRALLGQISFVEWAQAMALALVWCVAVGGIGRAVWKRGDLRYTGVGI